MKYRLQVTTNINHVYEIEANSAEHAEQIYTTYDADQLQTLDLDGTAMREQYPWDVEDITDETPAPSLEDIARIISRDGEEATDGECIDEVFNYLQTHGIDTNPAPLQIANASSAVASPELSAALAHARALAENPCNGGEPCGFGVYCNDNSGEWIETGFSDEEAAERFAAAYRSYSPECFARVGLVIGKTRNEWHGEELTESERPYLGCGNECGHSQVFSGWVDEDDIAHFPCPNCGTIFEHSNWTAFFDEVEESDDETPAPARIASAYSAGAIGAECVIRWERYKSATDKSLVEEREEMNRYISFSTYSEETDGDTFGVPDDEIFYYATREEFDTLCIDGEYHADGWGIVSFEWVTQ